tara:strand:- start:915 stop:1184 length:270 start_codon:yes stop_codon:yes gene_type:complete
MNDFQKSLLAMKVKEAQKKPCLLCGKKSDAVGIFFPDGEFAVKVGQPKGKTRVFVYSLCSRCKKKSDCSEKIDQHILAGVLSSSGNKQN